VTLNLQLTIAISVLTATIAGLGGQLASTKAWHKLVFWGCGSVIIILVSIQTYLNDKAQGRWEKQVNDIQADINRNQNASVGLYAIQPHGAQVIPPNGGARLEFNIGYAVKTNTAKNMREYFAIKLVSGPSSLEQDTFLSRQFKLEAVQHLDYRGQDRIIGTGDLKTLSIELTDKDIPGLYDGTKTIYILGEAQWINPSGSDGHLSTCNYLSKLERKSYISPGWANCNL
jgi:hypothetical protein